MYIRELEQNEAKDLLSEAIRLRANPKLDWTVLSVMPTWASTLGSRYYLLQNVQSDSRVEDRSTDAGKVTVLTFDTVSEWAHMIEEMSGFRHYEDSLGRGDYGSNSAGTGVPMCPTPPSRSPGSAVPFPPTKHESPRR